MKKILIATILMAVAVYMAFSYFTDGIVLNKYTDIQVAKEQKAIANGWIPEILPASAKDIIETHDTKSGDSFGACNYTQKDEDAFLSKLTQKKDDNRTFIWGKFLFRIDKEKNRIKFRNR